MIANVLNWIDRHTSGAGLAIVVLTFAVAAVMATAGQQARLAAEIRPTPALPVYILSTPAPTSQPPAAPTSAPDPRVAAQAEQIAQLQARLAALETERSQPAPVVMPVPAPPAQENIVYAAERAPVVPTVAPIVYEVATAVAERPGAVVEVVKDDLRGSDDPVVRASYEVFPPLDKRQDQDK